MVRALVRVGHPALAGLDRALAVDRVAQRVHHAAQKRVTGGHVHNRVCALDGVAFLDVPVTAENHDADIVAFEVQRHPHDAAGKLDHLAGLHVVKAVDPGDPVADAQHAADLGNLGLLTEVLDLLLQDRRNFSSLDRHLSDLFHCILEV